MPPELLFESLPNTWEPTSLGEACKRGGGDIQTGPFGSQLHAADYVSQGIPSIMPQNIGDNRISENGIARITPEDAKRLTRYLVQTGDIVYSRRGDVELRSLIREHENGWLCGTGCLRVRFGNDIDPLFASYYLGHPVVREWIVRHAHGATMPNLNTSILSEVPFVIPPQIEQRAIARILGSLDDKIELNRKMNQTLEAMARAIFKSWFVDFNPVRAKVEGRDPGLPRDLSALFPDSFEDSELGEIPKGWEIKTVADLAELNSWTLSKSDDLDRIEYVEISEVSRGDIGTIQVFLRGQEPSRARRRLRHGDTVLSTVRPDRGSYFLCLQPAPCLIASTGFAVFTPTTAPWSLIHAALTQPDLFEQLGHLADGGAYPAVRPEVIGQRQLPWPDKLAIAEAFHRICGPLYKKAEQNRHESRTLVAMRDALLSKLLSGEIRVKA